MQQSSFLARRLRQYQIRTSVARMNSVAKSVWRRARLAADTSV
jgi:hypothetical protein